MRGHLRGFTKDQVGTTIFMEVGIRSGASSVTYTSYESRIYIAVFHIVSFPVDA